MNFFVKRIIIVCLLIILLSLIDLLDNTIIRIFNFDEGIFELIVDLISPIVEVSLMLWVLLLGVKTINQIQDEEKQYKRLVQLSPEAIIIHNRGEIFYINDRGANLFGSSSTNELINRNISEFIHHESKDLYNNLIEYLDKFPNHESKQQLKIKRSDGAEILLEFISTKIEFKGQSARELIARDITIHQNEIENVKRIAYQDELTGLPNRRAFMDQLIQLLRSPDKNKMQSGVMFIDLDGFKQVNDTLGHEGGDILLKQVSNHFKNCVAEKDIVARLGGDEFIILLHNTNHNDCIIVANKIIESLSFPIIIFGKRVRVTPSIGIALYPQHGHEATELIKNADMAMYQAKQRGKNNYQIYEPPNKSNSII